MSKPQNSEHERAYQKAYRAKHREHLRANDKAYRAKHPEQTRAYGKTYRAKHRERIRAKTCARYVPHPRIKQSQKHYDLKFKYGISLDDYNQMLADQGGVCAGCYQPETEIRQGVVLALSVDHDHATGQVRQLLCLACNMALGWANENPDRLRALAAYVETHSS